MTLEVVEIIFNAVGGVKLSWSNATPVVDDMIDKVAEVDDDPFVALKLAAVGLSMTLTLTEPKYDDGL